MLVGLDVGSKKQKSEEFWLEGCPLKWERQWEKQVGIGQGLTFRHVKSAGLIRRPSGNTGVWESGERYGLER